MIVIRATTPTIKYTFKTVNVSNIVTAYLSIAKNDAVVLEKSLSDAIVGDGYIAWVLTQSETLSLSGLAIMMINWVTTDGTRGASKKTNVTFDSNLKEEVI